MKKRVFTLMMLLMAIRFAAEAHPVDLQTACEATARFVDTDTRMRVERDNGFQLVTSYRTANNTMALRVFNPENGFIIASANDCTTPILAYSDDSRSAYQITAVANPAEGGTISGDGTYYEGDLCTLIAVSNNDYDFVNWTKNGVEVSTDPVYSFMVTEDATYTANFELFDGLTVGDGSTSTNYYLPSYSFYCHSLTQQIYTPDDIEWAGAILSLGFYNDGGTKTQSYDIYMVNTDKTSFTSNYDWIPVTEEDLVFSGTVTMVSGGWTTIPLDSPFVYDGDSNLAIIIDNNTGSYTGSPYMACRVFGTEEVQAIRVYSDGTNYDPFNPSDYYGTLYAEKNQIRLSFDLISSEPTVVPDTLAMGYRPNNAWMSPYKFQIYNPGIYSLINSISTDNPYFQLEEVEMPFALGYHKSREISLITGNGDGEMTGHLIINYGDNQTVQFDLSAIAYDPAIKDVWETAYEIISYPFTDSLIIVDIPLYNNYNLPPDGVVNGADAVYKLVFEEDTYLNASLTSGDEGKIALYTEDFMSIGGPDLENNFTSVLNLNNTNTMGINNASFEGQANANRSGLFDELTVHDGSATNGYVPLYGFYADAYLRMEMVYPASELSDMTGSDIQNMKFYASQTYVNWSSASFMVFLTEVADVTINTFCGPAGTVVYEGALSIIDGEMNVTFTTPYHYNGGNLLVGIYSITTGNYITSTWYGENVNGASFQGYSYSGVNDVNGTQRNFLPKTTFNYMVTNAITNMTVPPGTYYLAASSTSDAWGIEINTDIVPCPDDVSNPTPADYDTDVIPTAVQLHWSMGERTTEYMLLLGTEYDNMDTIVDWTRNLTELYVVSGLLNNTNYFWQIKERSDGCLEGVEGPIWGFTTLLNGPQDLYAANYYLFEGDDLYLEWTPLADTNILSYNIYQDNVLIGNSTANNYTISGLTYNMEGYNFYVTAVYAGGESNPSYDITIWVSGNGSVEGHIYEQDGITSIENATVTFTGYDEFGYYRTFAFITDVNGYYTGSLKTGTYAATATCGGYQASHYNGTVSITYGEITEDIDIVMNEVFYPVAEVVAEYYPDATDPNSPYVKIYWDTNAAGTGWLYYDDGTNVEAIGTGGGNFWWGVMFPAGSYQGTMVTKVAAYDYMAMTGTVTIYNDGANAPANAVGQMNVTMTGSQDFVEYEFAEPVAIDPTKNIWVVFYNGSGAMYPAATCANTGDANGRWVSLDGSTWEDLAGYGLDYTFMLRAYVTNSRDSSSILANSSHVIQNSIIDNVTNGDNTDAVLMADPNAIPHYVGTPADANRNSRSFSHYRIYRTNAYNVGPYTEENTVLLADNVTDTLLIDASWQDAEHGVYKFGVSRVYEGNRESEISWGELRPNIPNRAYLPHIDADTSGKEIHYAQSIRAPWDLLATFYAAEGSQYGVASDGVNIYTCNWGYSSVAYNFYKYDMNGNVIEGFNIEGCGTIRDLTYDGQYFYGGSNGSTLYCINLANKQVVSTVNTQCDAIRHCSYDPIYDGFWVGGWSDLMLIDRNGNILQTAVSPSSCGGSGYYQAEDGTCHLYLFCEPTYVYDYDIATNTISSNPLYDVSNLPGINGTVGGAFIGEYNGKIAFFCDIQQSPNLIGIYELKDNYNSIQGERESAIVWSNPIDKSMYLTDGAVNITVTLNSGDSPEGILVNFTNLIPNEQSLYPVADVTLDASGYYAWNSFRRGDYQVQVSFNGYNTITEEMSIWEATDLNYVLEEINYGLSNLYVSRTGWAMWTDSEHGNTVPVIGEDTGDTFFVDFEEGFPSDWTTIDANNDGYTWLTIDRIGEWGSSYQGVTFNWAHNSSNSALSSSYLNGIGILYPDDFLVSPKVIIENGSHISFWAAATDMNYAADHFGIAVSTGSNTNANDFVVIQEWTMTAKGGSRDGNVRDRNNGNRDINNWYYYDVDLSAYAGLEVYLAFRHFNCSDQYILTVDDVELYNSFEAKNNRHFNNYQVELSDTEENVIYQGTISDCFIQLPVEDLVDGETYHLKVAAVYSSGISEWQEIDWVYQSCDNFEVVTELNMDMNDTANIISWTYPTIEERSIMTGSYPAYGCRLYDDGYSNNPEGWCSINLDSPEISNLISTNPYVYGGDYCPLDGYVHATYEDNNWFVIDPFTGQILNQGSLGVWFRDCAWDYTTNTMFGVSGSYLYSWDIENNATTQIGNTGYTMQILACDLDGQLYAISSSNGDLYRINKETGASTYVGNTGQYTYYVQSGGFDHYSGKLYWAGYGNNGFFAEVDTETGQATVIANNTGEVLSFCVPFNSSDYMSPVTGVLGAMIYRDGELLGFTTANTYTDSIATGNHEYAIRVVYDGMNRCPNFNAYYAMSCPLTIGGASYEVAVSANPAQGGVTTGAGTYINGFPCTVTATANENYVFTNWVMNGEMVANTPEYSFRVTDNTNMEANFIGFTPHWEVVNNPEYSPLSMIGIVNVNGEEQTGNYMEVAALCGNECRGRQMLTYYPDQNRFFVFMTIYGQDGDDITFSLYNHEQGEETEYSCLSHLTFDSEVTVGSYNDPYAILFGIIQTTAMQTGWNWYSTIVEQEGSDGLDMLEASLGSNGVMIKSQTDGFDINYNNLWMGNLDAITNEQMYMINTNAPIEAVVSGFSTNVNDHPITLYTGWTWVGYPHTEALDINDALANLTATNGDILKSKQTFSTYIEGQGWYGTLNTLEPSTGMMYHSKKNSNTTFTYSDAPGRMELIPNLTAENNHWIPNDFEYPDNMSVMAVVELNHVELVDGEYELAAFENGKCVGSAKLIYVDPTNRYMAFLTLSGEEDHVLSFGLYDAETGVAYTSTTETVVFTPNAIVGNMDEPFVVHFDEATGINQHDATMTVHPNPADRGSLFSITMSTNETVLIEITNALGEVVSVTSSSQTPMMVKAPNVAGIYMVRVIINGKESYSRKLIVK